MRTKGSPIAPIFRTANQGQALTRIYLRPQLQWTLAALARDIGVSHSTLHHEITRLGTTGLITIKTVGRSRVLLPNLEHPLARPLTEILEYIYGPRAVIAEEFSSVQGVKRLLIFGSWAARHSGVPGSGPHDIDVLVVGDPDRGAVYAAGDRASPITLRCHGKRQVIQLIASSSPALCEPLSPTSLARILSASGCWKSS
jgi:hypothetical protein